MPADSMRLLEDFCLRYLRGDLVPWFYQVFNTTRTVALFKNSDHDQIRPLGVKNPLSRTIERVTVSDNKHELTSFLKPQQLAMSKGGCNKLFFGIRMLLEYRQDFVCVKLDCRNAFNCCSRARLLKVYSDEPSISHLACNAAINLAFNTVLEDRGSKWGEGAEGFSQGGPKSSPEFCVSWHEYVKFLDAAVSPGGGMARFIMDDGYCVGPAELVFAAILRFETDIKEQCGLDLQHTKCEVFSWSGQMPDDCVPGFILAGTTVNGNFEPGFICVGAPIGADIYVKAKMAVKVAELREEVRLAVNNDIM